MTDTGLWNIAAQTPDRPAVIEPDGTVVSYAELAAPGRPIGRGLQALGLRPGDCVAGMLPNGSAALALFFAAMESGLYVVPVNWHLTAAEVAYILGDSEADAFVADERFAAVAAAAADQAGIAPTPGSRSATIAGFRRCPTWAAAGERPRRASAPTGAPMVYTSGTSGRPKGVRRALTGAGPGRRPGRTAWFFGLSASRRSTATCTCAARRSTTRRC